MPVLVLAIAEDLDKLFQNSGLTAVAALGELGRVVEVTVHLALVFVVGILSTEDRRAD